MQEYNNPTTGREHDFRWSRDEQDVWTHIQESRDFLMPVLYRDPLVVGLAVEILPIDQDAPEYHGKIGTLVKIDDHADDGDAYGVQFSESEVVYFWREELKIVE